MRPGRQSTACSASLQLEDTKKGSAKVEQDVSAASGIRLLDYCLTKRMNIFSFRFGKEKERQQTWKIVPNTSLSTAVCPSHNLHARLFFTNLAVNL